MTFRTRSVGVLGGGIAAVVLSAGAVAWACTPDEGTVYTPEAPPLASQDRSQPQAQSEPAADPAPAQAAAPAAEPAPVVANKPAAASPVRGTRSSSSASSASARPAAGPATASAGGAPAAPPAPAVTADAPAAPSLPGMESVAGDLWSGFVPAPSSAATGPGLTTPEPAGTSGNGGELALGVGLLGAGLVALGAGTGVTVLRRSRVRVAAGSR